jgi:hypothetical protein
VQSLPVAVLLEHPHRERMPELFRVRLLTALSPFRITRKINPFDPRKFKHALDARRPSMHI